MRVVREPAELDEALAAAAREAEAAFGDGTVFCERYVERPRHVEIQLLADAHGTVLALGERDCSVQRRHQKVLEESPSPALDPELRAEMSAAAVAFARAIGYQSAGTAEFMLAGREFWFLELNGRIQVEHPVTELVTGVDLVREQLRVAAGERLRVSETQSSGPRGRGAAVRRGSAQLPAPGRDGRAAAAADAASGSTQASRRATRSAPSYDPMIAKLIAHGPTRAEALARLADALAETEVGGRDDEPALPPLARRASGRPCRRGDDGVPDRAPAPLGAAAPPARRPVARRLAAEPAARAAGAGARRRQRRARPGGRPGQRQRDRTDAGNGDQRQGRSPATASRRGGRCSCSRR